MKRYTETELKHKKTAEKISTLMTRQKRSSGLLKNRELPGTITGFDDMLWNLLVQRLMVDDHIWFTKEFCCSGS